MKSGKKNVLRKLREVGPLTMEAILIVLMCLGVLAVTLTVIVVVIGGISSLCWNYAVAKMFSLPALNCVQACILIFTIVDFRTNYVRGTKRIYESLDSKIVEKRCLKKFLTTIIVIALLLVYSWLIKYTWNVIIAEMISFKLVKINLLQAFAFFVLVNYCLVNYNIDTKGLKTKVQDMDSKAEALEAETEEMEVEVEDKDTEEEK